MRVALVALLLLAPAAAAAQIRASERARVMQVVDGTEITVEYSRPRVRGRDSLFGTQVPHDYVWTPGANRATTLAVSRHVTIEGRPVNAGRYSVWIVTGRDAWEVVLDPDTTLFHTEGPGPRDGQVRFPARRGTGPFVEALTWSFPAFGATGATLLLQWATMTVPLEIRVTPTQPLDVDPAVGRRLEGRYDFAFLPDPKDSTGKPPQRHAFTIRHDGRRLRGTMVPPFDHGGGEFLLFPKTAAWFGIAEADGDGIREVWDALVLEFTFDGDRATGFDMRTRSDRRFAEARRVAP